MDHGWNGILARHKDGREGVIRENSGWCWVDLHIERDGQNIGFVQLACDGPDRGDEGWEWLSDQGPGDAVWLPLGEFDRAPEPVSQHIRDRHAELFGPKPRMRVDGLHDRISN